VLLASQERLCSTDVRFEVLTAVKILMLAFLVATPLDLWADTNVSEKNTASIFRADVLKAVCSFETLVSTDKFTWRYNPEDRFS
jgi:hypothetical protein